MKFAPMSALVAIAFLLVGCLTPVRHTVLWNNTGPIRKSGAVVKNRQQGVWTYWYVNGEREAEGAWKEDKQNGPWQWWYDSGQVKQEGSYVEGKREGVWRFFHANGKIASIGGYRDDRQEGIWLYYEADESLGAAGSFENGLQHGAWCWWNGPRRSESGLYCEGKRIGPWWSADSSEHWKDHPGPVGIEAYREPASGEPRRYGMVDRGRLIGLWATYGAEGITAAARFVDATTTIWQQWTPGGVASVRRSAAVPPSADDPLKDEDIARISAAIKKPLLQASVKAPAQETSVATAPAAKANAPVLSPLALLPDFWTKREEDLAANLIEKYSKGQPVLGYDEVSDFGSVDKRQRKELIGKELPQNRLLLSGGSVLDLKDYRGKKALVLVVLRGFSGQVCIYCSTQTAAIHKNLERFHDAGSEVVLVYPGPAESVPVFLNAVKSVGGSFEGLNIALDVDLSLVSKLGISHELAKPTSLIVDKGGIVRYAYVGLDRADRPSVDDLIKRVEKVRDQE